MQLIGRKCHRRILSHSLSLTCSYCRGTIHLRCLQLEAADVAQDENNWFCCMDSLLPFNHYHDEIEFKDAISFYFSYSRDNLFTHLDSLIFNPFELNENEFVDPMTDIDPDFQYFSDISVQNNVTNCQYFTEDTFNRKFREMTELESCLSILHVNIRSAPKNLASLEIMLSNLCIQFTIIGISETWFNEHSVQCYGINGYKGEHQFRVDRRGGGVSIFICNTIDYKSRTDLNILNENTESVFIEISKDAC